jgi:hypothetical protein
MRTFVAGTTRVGLVAQISREALEPDCLVLARFAAAPTIAHEALRRLVNRDRRKKASPAACNALDFCAQQAFNERWEIIVEPSLQHRPHQLANQIFERARIVHQNNLRQRIERAIDGRGCGVGKKLPALA